MNELFEDGLLETVNQAEEMMGNYEQWVVGVDGKEVGLGRGEKALVGHPESMRYYQNVLKSLVLWAEAVPKDPLRPNRESKFKTTLDKLSKIY